jgi:hypothetical protein
MRQIQLGDVIAIAVKDLSCPPVGLVTDCDSDAVELALYSWLTQRFTAGRMAVRRSEIRATTWATPITDEEQPLAGIMTTGEEDDEVVFDMDPLAAFQTCWTVPANRRDQPA